MFGAKLVALAALSYLQFIFKYSWHKGLKDFTDCNSFDLLITVSHLLFRELIFIYLKID